MAIKKSQKTFLALLLGGVAVLSHAENKGESHGQMMHHQMEHAVNDERVSLGLSPKMKQHQLSNMRSHLEAVQLITGLMVEEKFEKASEIAHSKLGLTEEMKRMCNSFNNDEFTALGLAFHESGDSLGEVLKTRDTTKSLHALQVTLGYCVQCHAKFRQ